VAEAFGPEAGLALLDGISRRGELSGYHLLPAARGRLLARLGRRAEASAAYREAFGLASNDAEKRFLERQIEEIGGDAARYTAVP
jgi:RNA polymerase sigma-70 factor (ECF subfamily)